VASAGSALDWDWDCCRENREKKDFMVGSRYRYENEKNKKKFVTDVGGGLSVERVLAVMNGERKSSWTGLSLAGWQTRCDKRVFLVW
jgi:hypothetical protein